jgi:NADH-quinone oxidoreductase subunit A
LTCATTWSPFCFILFDLGTGIFAALGGSLGHDVGLTGFVAVLIFLAVLVVGFAYEWKKGALDWE